jgi:hypothetical protein
VRMNLSFTRAAFIDQALEELSVVLENRLVGGKFWLPNRQEIEIKRSGTWMDFPARGIIRGRWEIGDYRFNLKLPTTVFAGPEIVQSPPAQLQRYPWTGRVLDSLPSDVRAVTEEDIKRVQDEARALVRAQALARAQRATLSARSVSDLVHVNRVEGLALGGGVSKVLGSGVTATTRARYGIDDHDVFGAATLAWLRPSGFGVRLFGLRDFREAGDEQERSSAVNSLAAQEFGSDYTDPYLARGAGVGLDFPTFLSFNWRLDATVERQDSLAVHAHPVVREFAPTIPAIARRLFRMSLGADRPPTLWAFGTELALRGELRGTWDRQPSALAFNASRARTFRAAANAELERPFGADRLVTRTSAAALWSAGFEPVQELVRLGGPVSAPGYDYHSLIGTAAFSEHVEWQFPVPFPAFSLGRFGRVPATAALAPFVHAALVARSPGAASSRDGVFPAIGAGFLTPFNLVRLDVARGVGRGGRWTFAIDVSREFWSIF